MSNLMTIFLDELKAQLDAEHTRANAAEAEVLRFKGLLNDAGERIEELHAMVEDELLASEAIELDPVLNEIKAALTDATPIDTAAKIQE